MGNFIATDTGHHEGPGNEKLFLVKISVFELIDISRNCKKITHCICMWIFSICFWIVVWDSCAFGWFNLSSVYK